MSFEDLQQNWQSHDHTNAITLDINVVLSEVRRNQLALGHAVAQRDFIEIVLGILMTGFWAYLALFREQWALIVPAVGCLAVATFLLVDRWSQRSRRRHPNDSLAECLKNSLREVKHQIWILQNAWWWYFSPLAFGAIVFFVTLPVAPEAPAWLRPVGVLLASGVCLIVFGFVYYLNRLAAKGVLSLRREELERLLASVEGTS